MKVFIMSHNPITDYNSMGKTMLGLFSAFCEDELCQFYVYPTLPNIKVCKSYYRLTDKEAMRSILFRRNAGRQINDEDINSKNTLYENKSSAKMYRSKEKHKELKIFLRDFVWKLSSVKNQSFKKWLEKEKPDVIFAAPGASGFFYNLIQKVAKLLKIPIVTYVCDDFYFSSKEKGSFIGRIYARYIRKKIRKLVSNSKQVVAISNELARDYTKEFGCECTVISTGANLTVAEKPSCGDGKIVSYFGNLQLGRYISLSKVARALDEYNEKFGKDTVLNIYTADKSSEISLEFDGISCARFCGFIPAEEMYKEMKKASVLIHVESFDRENRERVKYSVSTKIADSLACGICLFAYGPSGIASIEYLKSNDCAFTAQNEQELKEKITSCLSQPELRTSKAQKALLTASKNHDCKKQSELLKTTIFKVLA